jgi:histone acetyltransferase MYST1
VLHLRFSHLSLTSTAGYYLTLHPSTRNANLSPGTPERPLSDLGLKGYTAFWTSVILRFCRGLLADAPPLDLAPGREDVELKSKPKPKQDGKPPVEGRNLRDRRASNTGQVISAQLPLATINGVTISKTPSARHPGQHEVRLTLASMAKACHLRVDDTASTLAELGFLQHRRKLGQQESPKPKINVDLPLLGPDDQEAIVVEGPVRSKWTDVEVVISREAIEREWKKWGVREKPVLDEACVLL